MPTTAPYSPAPAGSTLPPNTPGPRNSRRPVIIAAIVAGVVVVTTAIAVGIIATHNTNQLDAAPPGPSVAPSSADRQVAAQERTCGVLRSGYPSVTTAIDTRNKFVHEPWTDSGRVESSVVVAKATGKLADDLDESLSADVAVPLRSAVVNYIAALRAVSVSETDHASDKQLNGVWAFYNNMVDAPLNICGIAG
ncbi:hypothetical protein [Mycobacteroides abscessus]|uniref:hypothetical protein n=1 Tax=Mycobacteroides abscessus TaxID=36809 RepID=UPI0009CAAE06|nr:hypothetical protein [Mycobacteroides abscessus]SKQ74231.1 Uncharacterised protein [Mycobacteroides abscessus subsp. massiliense]